MKTSDIPGTCTYHPIATTGGIMHHRDCRVQVEPEIVITLDDLDRQTAEARRVYHEKRLEMTHAAIAVAKGKEPENR